MFLGSVEAAELLSAVACRSSRPAPLQLCVPVTVAIQCSAPLKTSRRPSSGRVSLWRLRPRARATLPLREGPVAARGDCQFCFHVTRATGNEKCPAKVPAGISRAFRGQGFSRTRPLAAVTGFSHNTLHLGRRLQPGPSVSRTTSDKTPHLLPASDRGGARSRHRRGCWPNRRQKSGTRRMHGEQSLSPGSSPRAR